MFSYNNVTFSKGVVAPSKGFLAYGSVSRSTAKPGTKKVQNIVPQVATPALDTPPVQTQGVEASVEYTNGSNNGKATSQGQVSTNLNEMMMSNDNGNGSTRTKIICTIGPACCKFEQLEQMARAGMAIARLNLSHGTKEWHKEIISHIRKINADQGSSIAIMMDTQGAALSTQELSEPIQAESEDEFVFTIRAESEATDKRVVRVNYESLIDVAKPGDHLMVDGGMVGFEVVAIEGPDVRCRCEEPGLIMSKANLSLRRQNNFVRIKDEMLPVLTSKDWVDVDFAIQQEVDYLAVSFVRSADTLINLKSYFRKQNSNNPVKVVSKIESADSIPNLPAIIDASDAVMLARGDLGAQIPLEDIPGIQKEVVHGCRQNGKPIMVAAHLLQSMMDYPIPTRAEVADVALMVRQRVDGVILSGETAIGAYPLKSVSILRSCLMSSEHWAIQERQGEVNLITLSNDRDSAVIEQLCSAAAHAARNLKATSIIAFTRTGSTVEYLSRCRPDCPIYAFTDIDKLRRYMSIMWGVTPILSQFNGVSEENFMTAIKSLKQQGLAQKDDVVLVLSDLVDVDVVRTLQVRYV